MKQCVACKETKPRSEFYPHSSNKDGHYARCKACLREYARTHSRPPGSRICMTPEERERVTERAIAASFSDAHAGAMHRIAFSPELASEGDLEMWAEVVAGMVLQTH